MQIRAAERFFEDTFVKDQSYTGEKINAKINPIIIESKRGFSKRKDKTKSAHKIIVVVIFLKYTSSIFPFVLTGV